MIVVDANVVAYLVIPGDLTAHARRLRSVDDEWYVPPLFSHEWLSVVGRYVRGGYFDRDTAVRHYRRGVALVRIAPGTIDPLDVLNLVARSGCSSYDCQYVACAMDWNTRLVTLDKAVLEQFPDVSVSLKQF